MSVIPELQFAIADVVDDFPEDITIEDVVDTLRDLVEVILENKQLLKDLQDKRKRLS